MGARGRRSAAATAIALVQDDEPAKPSKPRDRKKSRTAARPAAPADLTPVQAEEWEAIVDRCPANWFPRETFPLLAQYCRYAVSVRRLGKVRDKLERAKTFDLTTYERVAKLIGRETQLLASLATKMRLSQHATYDKKKSKGPTAARPWED